MGSTVTKPEHPEPDTRRSARPTHSACAATKRGARARAVSPWPIPSLFVAAAARPSVSRHASLHPTDALGARRYEEEGRAASSCWKASTLRSGGRQAVGKPARRPPPDRRARRAPLRRGSTRNFAGSNGDIHDVACDVRTSGVVFRIRPCNEPEGSTGGNEGN